MRALALVMRAPRRSRRRSARKWLRLSERRIKRFLVMEPPGSHRARPARPGSIPIAYAARCPCRRGHARARARRQRELGDQLDAARIILDRGAQALHGPAEGARAAHREGSVGHLPREAQSRDALEADRDRLGPPGIHALLVNPAGDGRMSGIAARTGVDELDPLVPAVAGALADRVVRVLRL